MESKRMHFQVSILYKYHISLQGSIQVEQIPETPVSILYKYHISLYTGQWLLDAKKKCVDPL